MWYIARPETFKYLFMSIDKPLSLNLPKRRVVKKNKQLENNRCSVV